MIESRTGISIKRLLIPCDQFGQALLLSMEKEYSAEAEISPESQNNNPKIADRTLIRESQVL